MVVCECGKPLTARQRKWCSANCREAAAQKVKNEKYANRAKLSCVNCGGQLSGRQTKYCGLACSSDHATKLYNELIARGKKVCRVCDQDVPLSDFYPHAGTKDRLHSECKACTMTGNAERKTYTMKRRSYHLMSRYGITLEQYEEILKAQNGVCAVCFRPPRGKLLSVDHDHVTGFVRGLLCNGCNLRVIGKHRDGKLFHSAAKYLDSPPAIAAIGKVVAPKKNPKKKRAPRRKKK